MPKLFLMRFGDVRQNCINFLEELKERKLPVSIIVRQDYGFMVQLAAKPEL
jgi:hypothetical protein